MLKDLESIKKSKDINKTVHEMKTERGTTQEFIDCIAVSISPDLGERICLSAERPLIEEIFPELCTALMDTRNSGWHLDNHYVIRFPLNGFCKLNSIQVMQRLFNHSFLIAASTGGGVEGQQFSEYLFTRNCKSLHWNIKIRTRFTSNQHELSYTSQHCLFLLSVQSLLILIKALRWWWWNNSKLHNA